MGCTANTLKKKQAPSQDETRKKARTIEEILGNTKLKPHINIKDAQRELETFKWGDFSDQNQRLLWETLQSKLEEYKKETSEEEAQKIVTSAIKILNTLGNSQEGQHPKKVKQRETLSPSKERQQRGVEPASGVEEESHHSSGEGWGVKDKREQELYTYLKQELASITLQDPPFFKITTVKRREIYILGSLHDVHPQLLLSEHNHKIINKLHEEKAFLFIEHHTPYRYLMQDFATIPTNPLWDIKEVMNKENEEIWNLVKEFPFETGITGQATNILMQDIMKIDKFKGLLLFYAYLLDKQIHFSLGFESALLKKWGIKGVQELEEIGDNIKELENLFKSHPQEAQSFFSLGIEMGSQVGLYQYYHDEKLINNYHSTVRDHYKKNIKEYIYAGLKKGKLERHDEVTIGRNKIWINTIIKFLQNDQSNSPILIVCGMAHLEGSENLLELLMQRSHLFRTDEVKRLDKDGNEVPLSSPTP